MGWVNLNLHTYIHTYADGMGWVNLNFKFLSGFFENCLVEMEVDMYSTLVSAIGVMFGTTLVRYIIDTHLLPWWIRRGVSFEIFTLLLMRTFYCGGFEQG